MFTFTAWYYRFAGQVGYFTANIRSAKEAQVGDTFHQKGIPCEPLEGFREAKPMVRFVQDTKPFSLLCVLFHYRNYR